MKSWLAIVLAGAAALAVTGLPPERFELTPPETTPERERYEALRTELRVAETNLQMRRWSEWLSAAAVAAEPGSIAFGPPLSSEVTPEGIAEGEGSYRSAVEQLRPRQAEVRLGWFWEPLARGPARDNGLRNGSMTFAGVRDGVPYCFVVVSYLEAQNADLRAAFEQDGLGACRLYAQYGVPGAAIAEWLEAGGWGFGSRVGSHPDFLQLRSHVAADMPMFGTLRHPLASASLAVQGCLAGNPDACVRAVTDATLIARARPEEALVVADSPLSHYSESAGTLQPPFGYLDDTLLADAESEFGSEAFARFWSSDEPVAAAFATAFGVDMGSWLVDWVDPQLGVYRAGPSVAGTDGLLVMLALTVLAAMATRVAMRRRVG